MTMDMTWEFYVRLFVSEVPMVMAMFDRDMRYLAVRERGLTEYGIKDRDVIGRSPSEIFLANQEDWRAVHLSAQRGGGMHGDEDPFPRTDGK